MGLNYTWQHANELGLFFKTNGKRCIITSYRGNNEEVVIPDEIDGKPVKVIGRYAFARSNVRKVLVPDSVLRIEDGAFIRSKLKTFSLPKNIEYIGNWAFNDCEELEEVTSRRLDLTKVYFGIRVFTFSKFMKNTNIVILNDVLIHLCDKENVIYIPGNVKRIIPYAFHWETRTRNHFNKVYFKGDYVKIDSMAFHSCEYFDELVRKPFGDRSPNLPMKKMLLQLKMHGFGRRAYCDDYFYVAGFDSEVFDIVFTEIEGSKEEEKLVITLNFDRYLQYGKSIVDEDEKICFAYSYIKMCGNKKEIQNCLNHLLHHKNRTIRHLLQYQDLTILADLVEWQIIRKKNIGYAIQKAEQYGLDASVEFLKKVGNSFH